MSFDANGSPVEGPYPPSLPQPSSEKWAGVKALLKGFSVLGTASFPAHLCVVPDAREKDVTNSTESDYHIVVMVDARFPCHGILRVVRPYTAKDLENGETLYGWVDAHGNVFDHGERDIHDDHVKVVAWKACPKDFDIRA